MPIQRLLPPARSMLDAGRAEQQGLALCCLCSAALCSHTPCFTLLAPGSPYVRHAASPAPSLPARRGFRGAAAPPLQEMAGACRCQRLWGATPLPGCPAAPPPTLCRRCRCLSQWWAWRCAAEAPRADRSVDIEHSPDAEGSPWKMGYQVGKLGRVHCTAASPCLVAPTPERRFTSLPLPPTKPRR